MVKLFQQQGWTLARVKGSHHIMKRSGDKIAVIPVHGNKDLHSGIQRELLHTLEESQLDARVGN